MLASLRRTCEPAFIVKDKKRTWILITPDKISQNLFVQEENAEDNVLSKEIETNSVTIATDMLRKIQELYSLFRRYHCRSRLLQVANISKEATHEIFRVGRAVVEPTSDKHWANIEQASAWNLLTCSCRTNIG